MIAFDTNALIRMVVEDDKRQAKAVQDIVSHQEEQSDKIVLLTEVLIETVWVLESVYDSTREEVAAFLETLLTTPVFQIADLSIVGPAVNQYKNSGDFADLMIVGQAKSRKATLLFSFDKDLQKKNPGFVTEDVP